MNTYQRTQTIPTSTIGKALQERLFESPVTNYLRSLQSEKSRISTRVALHQIYRVAGLAMPEKITPRTLQTDGIHQYDAIYFVDWEDLRYADVVCIQRTLAQTRKATTVNQYMLSLKGVLRQARNMGLMSHDDYTRVVSIRRIPVRHQEAGRYVEDGELRRVLQSLLQRRGTLDIRNATLISLGYGCGLRIGEVESLEYDDYNIETGHLRVCGKGDHKRLTFVTNEAKTLLDHWCRLRGNHPGPLFLSRRGKRLSVALIYHALKTAIKRAGVPDFSFHDLRRKCVTDLLDQGIDAITVAKLVGHEKVTTTMLYDRHQRQRARESLTQCSRLIDPTG